MAAKRPIKGKVHIAPPGDFIALGKQTKTPDPDASKVSLLSQKKLSSGLDRKRDAPSTSGSGVMVKRQKLMPQGQTFTPLGRSETERRSSPAPPPISQFEELAIEVDPHKLLDEILEAEDTCNDERVEGLFCGAIKHLHTNRSKPDPAVYLTLMYLAKTHSIFFNTDVIIQAFCSLLKRDLSLNFKSKGNSLVSVFACGVLMAAFDKEDNWPDDLVKVFVDDSLGERVWVDRGDCKGFVDNIITAFNTNLPAKPTQTSSTESTSTKETSGTASPVVMFLQEEDESSNPSTTTEEKVLALEEMKNITVTPRYQFQKQSIESYILDIIRDQFNKRQPIDSTSRNLIRLLTVTCGYGEVRLLAVQKLEIWLQNPKLSRTAQELLMAICMNCNQHDQTDLEVISLLIKIRMKTKPLLNHFLNCLRELLGQHSDNLRLVMTHTIYNELSNTRNPNNMAVLGVLFQQTGEEAARILAEIVQDLLANKDDYLRAVRMLLREITRTQRHDVNFSAFCLGLFQERVEAKFLEMDHNFKERYVSSIADLVALSIFLSITPTVRESASALTRGEKKDLETLHNFRQQVAVIQRDAVWWLHTVVPKIIEVKLSDYVHCLHKVLFMENAEAYFNVDNWPPEADRVTFLHLSANVPVLEDTLMRILVIGLSRDLPLTPPDAVELSDQLIKRAASLCLDGQVVLRFERLELVDALFNLCTYRHPTDITLPKGYKPPNLAISNLYWKSWVILLILAAFNPRSFGVAGWDNYPTLRCMMEMAMTRNYSFPPPTMAVDDKSVEEIKNREKQISEQEKQLILEFEGHLAAATSKVTITEANSLLVKQLTTMDPTGKARRLPSLIAEQVQILNDNLHIGQMLCRSRQPDFLLDIIQRQGTSQSMPWLAELVESSEGSLDVLPVQCLCEFLLHDGDMPIVQEEDGKQMEKHMRKQKVKKREQLLQRLQSIVHSSSDSTGTTQVLDYFLKRLASTQASNRVLAIKGLSMVVSKAADSDEHTTDSHSHTQHKWLFDELPTIPAFSEVKVQICEALRQACQIETVSHLVSAYIIFLSEQTLDQTLHELDDLALDMAQLIVERTSVINHILPQDGDDSSDTSHSTLRALIDLYTNYLRKAKEPSKEAYNWSNTQDQIILQWEGGDSATMHVLVVHAMIILLTYGPPKVESPYSTLLDTWFPENGHPPSAFLLDTSEEALLLPDWLKLRMIRSHVKQLVDVALQDIEPGQLLLFVQSFGIPVASMSCLFQCLDNAVTVDPGLLEQALEDKSYMAQLIEIQHLRGVKGGDVFYKLLKQGSPVKARDNDDEEMKEVPEKQLIWNQGDQPKRDIKPQLMDLVIKIFSPDTQRNPEVDQQYHKLIKRLSSNDTSEAIEVTQVLLELLGSQHGANFGTALCRNPKLCALIKGLITKQDTLGGLLYKLMETIAKLSGGQKSPLCAIVKQYLKSVSSRSKDRKAASLGYLVKEDLNGHQILDELKKHAGNDEDNLERVVKKCMHDTMMSEVIQAKSVDESTQKALTSAACTAVIEDSSAGTPMSKSLAILFVDWLELLDPDIVKASSELAQQLLFAKQTIGPNLSNQTKSANSQPYLLAVLTHQSSWTSLCRCIDCLLKRDSTHRYNATMVLNFLWACLQIPKIWQGRDRHVPKNYQPEDVLSLTVDQLISVATYIIEEASGCEEETREKQNGQKLSNQSIGCIADRIDLLMSCICNNHGNLKCLVTHIQSVSPEHQSKQLYQQLLVEMYSQCPKIMLWLTDIQATFSDGHLSQSSLTQVDLVSHRLLTSLGQAGHGKRAEDRMYDANIACRKLASQHPLLMLRQLPLIAALLKGKTQFTFGEMRHKNYLLLFTHILGLMETLQPHIFRKEHTALGNVIESYFALISNHGREKQLGPMIVKFIKFLHHYATQEPQLSTLHLQKFVDILNGISTLYPDLGILKSLLAGLTLPRQIKGDDLSTGEVTMVIPPRPSSPWTVSQLSPFLNRLKNASCPDEMMEVLKDLDETSKRKVDILEHFVGDLKEHLSHKSDTVRNTTFSLVMRHIRQNPKSSEQFVGNFLQCLDNDNPDIVTSALKNLPEFCVLCQDHADIILQKSFSIGTTTSVETSSYITETLQLLNLETTQV